MRNRANGSSRRPTRIKHRRHEDVGRYSQLHDGLWNQLPITDVFQAASDDTIARATAHCSDLLHQRQDEIRKFVRSLCYHVVKIRVRGELHPQAVADALDKARRPFLAALDQVIVPLKPILTAELIAQPLPIIQDAVRQWLHDSTHTVANQLVLSLHTLVEMDVVGIIEWPGPRACKLNFFRHTIEQDRVGSRKTTTVRQVTRRTLAVEEWERPRARNRYSIERHEHHVMNAEARELEQTRYPIPREYNELIDCIPEWLSPHVRVLEGDLILERIVQRQIREEQWESTPKLRNAYEIEPAILLGHYVLTGWGQQEVDRETHRLRREQTSEAQAPEKPSLELLHESGKLQIVANTTAAAAVAMMLFSRLQHGVMLPLSLLLSAAAIVVFGQSLRVRSQANNYPVDLIDVGCRTVAAAFGLLTIQSALFGMLYGSWSMLGLAFPLALAAAVTWGLATSRQSE